MFKYQKETLENLEICVNKLENITDRVYKMKIGTYKDSFWNGSEWIPYNEDLYLYINKNSNFVVLDKWNNIKLDTFTAYTLNGTLKLDKDIYLKLNKLIDRIYNDIKEDKEKHAVLNQKLELILKNL